ncbi:AraC family transcriptional regulator [Rhodobacteraceae bacterium]|nr:AraC family transcriptional regulator [Paracoccaceae bacterium]
MIFVPLSLFASVFLGIVLIWFARTHDMSHRAHQLFFVLVALYSVQSFLISLRWGYDVMPAASAAAVLAPVLPVVAYLSYGALSEPLKPRRLWPLIFILLNWLALAVLPELADVMILMTYLGFGGLLVRLAWRGPNQLALSPLDNAQEIVTAMALTGLVLIASGLTDIYVIFDFIRNEGRYVGLIVSVVQTAFVLVIGACAAFGRVSQPPEVNVDTPTEVAEGSVVDDAHIMTQLDRLFGHENLHRNEELSLRRIARRLGVPDRKVSNAINRSTGLSVSQFVNNHRIKDACQMLATTQDMVLVISLVAGFATKSNFNREFVRVTGLTPSVWRKENAGSGAAVIG